MFVSFLTTSQRTLNDHIAYFLFFIAIFFFGISANAVTPVISAGENHTCALTTSGVVKCWGHSAYGQLGNGSTYTSIPIKPVRVAGLSSAVLAISSGGKHTCALDDGAVKCWGYNFEGQLGDGTKTDHSYPVQVTGLSGVVVSIAAGQNHTCALTSGGAVKCWGDNYNGQLGNIAKDDSSIPVDVSGLDSGVKAITSGDEFSCALIDTGKVKCWGRNYTGYNGVQIDPVEITTLDNVVAISAGYNQLCVLTDGGVVKCLGENYPRTPYAINGFEGTVVSIDAGRNYVCAVTDLHVAQCWGVNGIGQLGNGNQVNSATPVTVNGFNNNVIGITAGGSHSCAFTDIGQIFCWGTNYLNQLGNGVLDYSDVPVDVVGLNSGVRSISAGDYHTCSLSMLGAVKCWGQNQGTLGAGTLNNSSIPLDVIGLTSGVAKIVSGKPGSCALTDEGAVKCWNYSHSIAEVVDGLESGIVSLGAGGYSVCALTADGIAKCTENINNDYAPFVFHNSLVDVAAIDSSILWGINWGQHSCALTSAGAVKCWGDNFYGQLGDGTRNDSEIPVAVTGLDSGVIAIALGAGHTCALTVSQKIKCWGRNDYGQLGNGSRNTSLIPVDVIDANNEYVSIAAGYGHTCAITATGAAKCWGYNTSGQVGNGTGWWGLPLTPSQVEGLDSHVVEISAGFQHTCALTDLGSVKCWGSNISAQLGNGINNYSSVPVSARVNLFIDDSDDDGILDPDDNCLITANQNQLDTDVDGLGNVCDLDDDNDGQPDTQEISCGSEPLNAAVLCVPLPDDQILMDYDHDGRSNAVDNCPFVFNVDQLNIDGDSQGNACDLNDDNDSNSDSEELVCGSDPLSASSICDDTDGDGILNALDNCPANVNPAQQDSDADGKGDICDNSPVELTTLLDSSAMVDGYILESNETSKTGGKLDAASQTLMVGDNAKNQEYRSVLSFDTSALPDNAVILSASLQLVSKSTKGSVSSLGALTADIRKPYLGAKASLALNDFAASVDKTSVVTLKKTGSSYKGNLNASGKSLINKKGTTQLRLHFAKDDDNDKKEDWLSFYSGNAAAGKKPVLKVDYYVP